MEVTKIGTEKQPIKNGIGNNQEERIRKKKKEEENKNPGKITWL